MSLFRNFSLAVAFVGLGAIGIQATGGLNKTSGAHPGSTGAPREKTCAQYGCHIDASVNKGDSVNFFTLLSTDTLYKSGKTYDMKLRVEKTFISKFGFMITALSDKDSLYAGELKPADQGRVQLVGVPSERMYLTHTANGTIPDDPGTIEWNFQWKAPAINKGPVTFYIASNCTNRDNRNSGDAIFLSQWKMDSDPANPTVGIAEKALPFPGKIFSADRYLYICSANPMRGNLRLMDLKGATVLEARLEEKIALPEGLNGIYLYSIYGQDGSYAGKVVVR